MRQGYAFVSVGMCVCVCVCVWTKNTLVYVSPLENLHKNSLCSFFTEFIVTRRRFLCWQALFERLIHGYLKLRVLVRALYGIVGVSPNLLSHVDVLTQSHMYSTSEMRAQNLIIATVYQPFLRPSVMCQSIVSACMLSSIILELSMG